MASYNLTCFSSQLGKEADVHAKTDDGAVIQIRLSSPDRDEVKSGNDVWFKVPTRNHPEGVNVKVSFETQGGYVAETKYCHIDVLI
jgi:hypothetical protein